MYFLLFFLLQEKQEREVKLCCTVLFLLWGYEEDKNVFKHANKNACLVLFSYRGLWYLAIFYPKV